MKKSVHSWEFWAVVFLALTFLYALYQVFQAVAGAEGAGAGLVNDLVGAPGNAANGVASAGEGFLSWLWSAITGGGSDSNDAGDGGSDDGSGS